MKQIIIITATLLYSISLKAQLAPGFNKTEYIQLLNVFAQQETPTYAAKFEIPANYKPLYKSPIMGLDNHWALWQRDDNVAVICIRGTTANTESWLANFYAAMIPAQGQLVLTKNDTFKYSVAQNPKAAVHVGWMISLAYLSKDILLKIDSCSKAGITDFIIMGHSQGGAIAYLLTAYLHNLQIEKAIPAQLKFKTYCSAAPKPGNLFFAYEYEAATKNGWAYNVVNSADWVPETPLSLQTLNDFNTTNPFTNIKPIIKKQPFFKRVALKRVYNQLNNPSKKAQKRYKKYLGNMVSKFVKSHLGEDFKAPQYYNSSNYVRTGNTIVLLADEEYYRYFADDNKKIFIHHFLEPYLYLVQKLD